MSGIERKRFVLPEWLLVGHGDDTWSVQCPGSGEHLALFDRLGEPYRFSSAMLAGNALEAVESGFYDQHGDLDFFCICDKNGVTRGEKATR